MAEQVRQAEPRPRVVQFSLTEHVCGLERFLPHLAGVVVETPKWPRQGCVSGSRTGG